MSETLESLLAYCAENNRAIPRDWNGMYQRLKNKTQKPSGGWEPPLPLILAAWDITMPIEKILRFQEHLQWADKEGQIEEIGAFLRELSEVEWYHFGELPT